MVAGLLVLVLVYMGYACMGRGSAPWKTGAVGHTILRLERTVFSMPMHAYYSLRPKLQVISKNFGESKIFKFD
jgi:hypothetical protein